MKKDFTALFVGTSPKSPGSRRRLRPWTNAWYAPTADYTTLISRGKPGLTFGAELEAFYARRRTLFFAPTAP